MAIDTPAVKTTPDSLGPSFSIISKELSTYEGEDGRRRFRLTASSTIEDMAGDEIEVAALQKAAVQFREGKTIFMDHDFKHVESAFGVTDSADVVQKGVDPKTGKPLYDLDISGPVNVPNPRAVQLADSIDGGYVRLGASLTAFVRKHAKKSNGGMLIKDIDVVEASVVGIAENQRSWAHKAAIAVKSYRKPDWYEEDEIVSKDAAIETEEVAEAAVEDEVLTTSKQIDDDALNAPAADEAGEEHETTEPEAEAAGEAVEDAQGGQESAPESETPETAPDVAEDAGADSVVEKAASVVTDDEVKELLGHVTRMATEIGVLREENATLISKIATLEASRGSLATEVEQARTVISKVMELPLRSQTSGYVESFAAAHPMFAPEVQDFLNKRSKHQL